MAMDKRLRRVLESIPMLKPTPKKMSKALQTLLQRKWVVCLGYDPNEGAEGAVLYGRTIEGEKALDDDS
jgi:hypothetical protein